MKEYTYTEARQGLAALLERARKEGSVRIRRQDGSVFVLKPERVTRSPLDVNSVDIGLTKAEILAAIREGRRPV